MSSKPEMEEKTAFDAGEKPLESRKSCDMFSILEKLVQKCIQKYGGVSLFRAGCGVVINECQQFYRLG